ncbi:MAG TPA: hypothetical protein PKN44_06765 [Bacteroidales bacterium]|nr:hypothetical protein [Bacteroidales bacterium]
MNKENSIINQISTGDLPEIRTSLREMMDAHFLQFGGEGSDAAYSAFLSMDKLLESLSEYHQQKEELATTA